MRDSSLLSGWYRKRRRPYDGMLREALYETVQCVHGNNFGERLVPSSFLLVRTLGARECCRCHILRSILASASYYKRMLVSETQHCSLSPGIQESAFVARFDYTVNTDLTTRRLSSSKSKQEAGLALNAENAVAFSLPEFRNQLPTLEDVSPAPSCFQD